MEKISLEQIRLFRLWAHRLDREYGREEALAAAGACGLQNSPPGAWETALHCRVPSLSLTEMQGLLYRERSLLQAWSLRGAPVVFPTGESGAFLAALVPQGEEPWAYTKGIGLALDALGLSFDFLLALLQETIPRLEGREIVSKTALDQTLAEWMTPRIPPEKRPIWTSPSPYGMPDKQTMGGAAVSFLLRPCSFLGLVVFGERAGASPSFTAYQSWVGRPLAPSQEDGKNLARKFLHCYGPAAPGDFAEWLGCSGAQARRLWACLEEEAVPVDVGGKRRFLLAADRDRLLCPEPPRRELLLLGGHDPYLDQREREVLLPNKARQRQVWKTTANPGAVVYRGEIAGIWTSRKKKDGAELSITLWREIPGKERLAQLAEEYAAFRGLRLLRADTAEA